MNNLEKLGLMLLIAGAGIMHDSKLTALITMTIGWAIFINNGKES